MKILILFSLCVLSLVAGLAAAPGDFRWSFATNGAVYSSPAIDDAGNVYFGSEDGDLYSVTATGQVRWVYPDAGDWIDSSPAIGPDGTIYFGSWDGFVYAVNGATGSLRWSYETGSVVLASPTVGSDGAVYVGSYDGGFYALNSNGSLRWIHVAAGEIESSAALDENGDLYFGDSGGILHAVDGTGQARWEVDVAIYQPLATEVAIQSSPALGADGTIYVGSRYAWTSLLTGEEVREGRLLAVDRATGSVRWTFLVEDYIDSSPAVAADGSVYFGARDGYLYKLDADGIPQWELLVGDVFYASPAIDEDGNIYLGSYAGQGLSVMNAVSPAGALLWAYPFDGYNDSSPNLSPDGQLYFGAHNYSLIALSAGAGLASEAPWPRFRGDLGQTGSRQESFVYVDPEVMAFFPSAQAVGGGWYWIDWMGSGWFYAGYFRWIEHDDHSWLYCTSGTGDAGWFWDPSLGWLYAQREVPNFFYHHNSGSWTYHAPGTTVGGIGRWFFVYATQSWMHEDGLAGLGSP